MRVSIGIHQDDIDAVIESYNLMSQKLFTHASPTLFNAATPKPQLSSCFLMTVNEDSIEGIYDTVKVSYLPHTFDQNLINRKNHQKIFDGEISRNFIFILILH